MISDDEKTNQPAAVSIIKDTEGRFLLLKRSFKPFGWCLVGGKIEVKSESIAEGLAREIKEEIGLTVSVDDLEFIKKAISINGRLVYVYQLKNPIKDKVKLSCEHCGYMFVNNLDGIELAGNTKDFIENN